MFDLRRSTLDARRSVFFIYIRYIKCSSFVRLSTFDAQFCLHMYQKVRPSTYIQYFYHTFIQKEFLNVERRIFAGSIVHAYKKLDVECRTSNILWFYRTCIQKRNVEGRRSNIPYFYHTCIQKIERRTSNDEPMTNIQYSRF